MASSPQKQISGKLIIFGIVLLALTGAGASWLFRYSATRRAAEFWGSNVIQLIRDAPEVNLVRLEATDETKELPMHFRLWSSGKQVKAAEFFDVSEARGLTHLRNALLEDRSYSWPPRAISESMDWRWMLGFRDESHSKRAFILFTADCAHTALLDSDFNVISCQPIAHGLSTMFAEYAATLPPARQR
jgi:hypothetical protein